MLQQKNVVAQEVSSYDHQVWLIVSSFQMCKNARHIENFLKIAENSWTNPTKRLFPTETRPFYAKYDEIKCILSILRDKSKIYWFLVSLLVSLCRISCGNSWKFTETNKLFDCLLVLKSYGFCASLSTILVRKSFHRYHTYIFQHLHAQYFYEPPNCFFQEIFSAKLTFYCIAMIWSDVILKPILRLKNFLTLSTFEELFIFLLFDICLTLIRQGGINFPPKFSNDYSSGTESPIDLKPGCNFEFIRCLEV